MGLLNENTKVRKRTEYVTLAAAVLFADDTVLEPPLSCTFCSPSIWLFLASASIADCCCRIRLAVDLNELRNLLLNPPPPPFCWRPRCWYAISSLVDGLFNISWRSGRGFICGMLKCLPPWPLILAEESGIWRWCSVVVAAAASTVSIASSRCTTAADMVAHHRRGRGRGVVGVVPMRFCGSQSAPAVVYPTFICKHPREKLSKKKKKKRVAIIAFYRSEVRLMITTNENKKGVRARFRNFEETTAIHTYVRTCYGAVWRLRRVLENNFRRQSRKSWLRSRFTRKHAASVCHIALYAKTFALYATGSWRHCARRWSVVFFPRPRSTSN